MRATIQTFQAFLIVIISSTILIAFPAHAQSPEQDGQSTSEQFEAKFNTDAQRSVELDFEFVLPEDLQRDLPQAAAREIQERPPAKDPWFDLSFLGPILKLLFWGILAVALLFVAYAVISEIIRARKNFAPKNEDEDLPDIPVYTPDEEEARVLLDDADKLAAEGKYEEAVHILLFRSIQDISAKRPHYVKRSLTSREISALPILTQKAKDGFSTIGRLVESSFFGGKPLDAADYALSKDAYKSFAFEKVAR
jgi:hypothetical protein